jgi:hypothetical protein
MGLVGLVFRYSIACAIPIKDGNALAVRALSEVLYRHPLRFGNTFACAMLPMMSVMPMMKLLL